MENNIYAAGRQQVFNALAVLREGNGHIVVNPNAQRKARRRNRAGLHRVERAFCDGIHPFGRRAERIILTCGDGSVVSLHCALEVLRRNADLRRQLLDAVRLKANLLVDEPVGNLHALFQRGIEDEVSKAVAILAPQAGGSHQAALGTGQALVKEAVAGSVDPHGARLTVKGGIRRALAVDGVNADRDVIARRIGQHIAAHRLNPLLRVGSIGNVLRGNNLAVLRIELRDGFRVKSAVTGR